jgi:hypothetical protein
MWARVNHHRLARLQKASRSRNCAFCYGPLSVLPLRWLLAAVVSLAFFVGAPLQDSPDKVPQSPPAVVAPVEDKPEKPSVDKVKDAIDEALERSNERMLVRIIKALEAIEPVPAIVPIDVATAVAAPDIEHLPPPRLPSQPGFGVAAVTSHTPGGWVILKFDRTSGFVSVEPYVLESSRVCMFEGPPGSYVVMFLEEGKGFLQPKTFNVTIGIVEAPPPVVVDPVDPTVPPVAPVDPLKKTTRVTFVYEKDQSNTPRPVAAALQRLNTMGILASEFEEDSLDGSGEVPDQYKIALEAARSAGLPALVVQSGDVVKRVVKNPTTEAAVMEAAK